MPSKDELLKQIIDDLLGETFREDDVPGYAGRIFWRDGEFFTGKVYAPQRFAQVRFREASAHEDGDLTVSAVRWIDTSNPENPSGEWMHSQVADEGPVTESESDVEIRIYYGGDREPIGEMYGDYADFARMTTRDIVDTITSTFESLVDEQTQYRLEIDELSRPTIAFEWVPFSTNDEAIKQGLENQARLLIHEWRKK